MARLCGERSFDAMTASAGFTGHMWMRLHGGRASNPPGLLDCRALGPLLETSSGPFVGSTVRIKNA